MRAVPALTAGAVWRARAWALALTLTFTFALAAVAGLGSAVAWAQSGTDVRLAGPLLASPAAAQDLPAPPWRVVGLPGQSKPFTRFTAVTLDGQRVLRVVAQASYGNLVHGLAGLAMDGADSARRLSWRWRLDEPNPAADLRRKEGDDSPIKVCALFDLPLSALPFGERQLLRLARQLAGEALPSATVCYVWDNRLPPGTVLDNAYSRRIRMIVLRGAEAPLRSWLNEQRDVAADFLRLFGDEAQTVPPLLGVLIGADADNTQQRSLAFVGAISLE